MPVRWLGLKCNKLEMLRTILPVLGMNTTCFSMKYG